MIGGGGIEEALEEEEALAEVEEGDDEREPLEVQGVDDPGWEHPGVVGGQPGVVGGQPGVVGGQPGVNPEQQGVVGGRRPPAGVEESRGQWGVQPPAICYVQRALMHPDDGPRVFPWLVGSLVVRAGNALSDDRVMDADLTPAAVSAATGVVEFYCLWALGIWISLTWLFLLTDGGRRWCGVGMRVPRWVSATADLYEGVPEPYDSIGARVLHGAGVPLWYLARAVRDDLQPRIMDASAAGGGAGAGGAPPWLFLVLFLSVALVLSVVSGDTWWWVGACTLLPMSFVDAYTRSQRLPSELGEIARSPLDALKQAIMRVITPASSQYLRMFLLAAALALLWLPFVLPVLVRGVFALSLVGIPLCSLRSTPHTVRAMWTAHSGRVPRVFAMLTCGACVVGVRQTLLTLHHPPALALLLTAQGALFVSSLLTCLT